MWGPSGDSGGKLLLDTGAARSLVSRSFLSLLGYDLSIARTRQRIITASGMASAPELRVTRIIAIGRERLDFPLLCYDLPQVLRVDGLLGLDFMRKYRLTVDFQNGFLSLR